MMDSFDAWGYYCQRFNRVPDMRLALGYYPSAPIIEGTGKSIYGVDFGRYIEAQDTISDLQENWKGRFRCALLPARKDKPMKKIFCPCCGHEMNSFNNEDNYIYVLCPTKGCAILRITFSYMSGITTEKAARRAWNESLIGKLRKWYRQQSVIPYFRDIPLIDLLRQLFGGSDAPRAE